MHDGLDHHLKHNLAQANLYGLLAKKYEYVDPQKHMYFYLKHFHYVQKVEELYMMNNGNAQHPFYQIPTETQMY